jgi:hypothetical protein
MFLSLLKLHKCLIAAAGTNLQPHKFNFVIAGQLTDILVIILSVKTILLNFNSVSSFDAKSSGKLK